MLRYNFDIRIAEEAMAITRADQASENLIESPLCLWTIRPTRDQVHEATRVHGLMPYIVECVEQSAYWMHDNRV